MNALLWAGTVAGALAAIGTVLRWTLRRLVRVGIWAAAVSALPDVVDQLARSVDQLARRVDQLQPSNNTVEHP